MAFTAGFVLFLIRRDPPRRLCREFIGLFSIFFPMMLPHLKPAFLIYLQTNINLAKFAKSRAKLGRTTDKISSTYMH